MYDLLLRGGTLIDGTGSAPRQADVAVSGGRIVDVGTVTSGAAEIIDARGCIVTPGFVDIHTHYDGQVMWEERLAPSSDHGVTTVVMGNCGVGFAPARPDQHSLLVRLLEGVEDIPEVVMTEGLPWNWETFPEYLDALDRRRADVDFAAQVPHSPLRVYVMGQRGVDREPPTDADLAEMRRLTCEAIEAGAIGVTTSRAIVHAFRDGQPAPSIDTQEQELVALAGGLKDAGRGVFQLVPNLERPPVEEFAMMRRIAESSGQPLSFVFVQVAHQPDNWRVTLEQLDAAVADGVKIKGQFMPRPIGMLFGLDLSYHPFSLNPSFKPLADLPLADKVAALRDPGLRKRLLAEEPDDPNPFFSWVVKQTHLLFPLRDPPNYNPDANESMAARAKAAGIDPMEVIYDQLLADEGHAILYCPMGNSVDNRFDSAGELLGSDNLVLGLGDGGAHYGMICDASYPTLVLTQWTRDRATSRLDLPTAVKMLAADTACAVGLLDRGIVAPGYKADLNVIDIERLRLHRPSVKRDLPAGGRRLSQKADGYVATIVSGVPTYREGLPTGALPGRLVRGQRPIPA